MTQLNPTQREAMRRAKLGDWDLADAMEVIARQAAGAVRIGGRIAWLILDSGDGDVDGMLIEDKCDVCDGKGATTCHECEGLCTVEDEPCEICSMRGTLDCDDCDGTGEIATGDHFVSIVDGHEIWPGDDGFDELSGSRFFTASHARAVLFEYQVTRTGDPAQLPILSEAA